MELVEYFEQVNNVHFDGFLDMPVLRWNSRLRASAGRFISGSRTFWHVRPAVIEVAAYLRNEQDSEKLILDTIAHEMIHYWLWIRRRPYGHTSEFWIKMKAMGVSRYNPVPKLRPYRHIYSCPECGKDFPSRRRLGALACAACCKAHAGGRYDARFRLLLKQSAKGAQLLEQDLRSLGCSEQQVEKSI